MFWQDVFIGVRCTSFFDFFGRARCTQFRLGGWVELGPSLFFVLFFWVFFWWWVLMVRVPGRGVFFFLSHRLLWLQLRGWVSLFSKSNRDCYKMYVLWKPGYRENQVIVKAGWSPSRYGLLLFSLLHRLIHRGNQAMARRRRTRSSHQKEILKEAMSYHHQLVSIFWTFFIDIVIQNKETEIIVTK